MNVPSNNNKNVYIIDDDESVCRALKTLLTTYDFVVKTFNSAKSFFDSVSNDASGCLLLDIFMPEMDGWAVQKRIKDSGSKRPVIFISAENPEIVEDRALKAGAVGFFQKPVKPSTICRVVLAKLKK